MSSQNVQIHTFTGTEVTDILRLVASWFDDNPSAVLIGLWNSGFGEAWELCIQVVVDPASSDLTVPNGRVLYREDQP